MRFLRLILVVVVASVSVASPVACAQQGPGPPIDPPPSKVWRLGFDVQFDGDSLDPTKLTPCFDWNYGNCTSTFNKGKEHYLPSQVQLSNGVAHLVAEPLD